MSTSRQVPIDRFIRPFQKIMEYERSGAIILFLCVIIAIILANSPIQNLYHEILEYKLGFQFNGKTYFNLDVLHWINDGLMALFFFVVGLELKKEFVGGELAQPRKAILPIAAALGGMAGPALIYLAFNANPHTHHGWGIPTATDIAFAVGALMFLGKRVPLSLKVFLLALAIVDDLGAIVVIALFYPSETISFVNLGIGFAFFAAMLIGNKMGVRNIFFYAILGICGLWTAFLFSGVHATIAAVLAAFTIPAEVNIKEKEYLKDIREKLNFFEKIDPDDQNPVLKEEQLNILEDISKSTSLAMTPLQKFDYALSPISTFIVLPIFAIANAGVSLNIDIDTLFSTHIAIGVALGLLLGKTFGIFAVTSLLVKLGIGKLPEGMDFKNLIGVGIFASIGFTMSLFVTSLAFVQANPAMRELYENQAKIGVFAGSILGGVIGYIYLSAITKKPK